MALLRHYLGRAAESVQVHRLRVVAVPVMGELTILDKTGDIRVEWDPDDAESTAKAKAEYDRLKQDGYNFYEVTETRGRPVKRWSKGAGRLIAAPGARSEPDKKAERRPRAMAGGPNTRVMVLR